MINPRTYVLAKIVKWRIWYRDRKRLRQWQSMHPEQQLAHFVFMLAASKDMRRAFRKALHVRALKDD